MVQEKTISLSCKDPNLTIYLRPLTVNDVTLLLDLFDHMGPDSRYNRFNMPLIRPDIDYLRQEASKIAAVPPEVGQGWLILADLPQGETILGGIRFLYEERESRETAEISLVVRDDFQGRGIGTSALSFAAMAARELGVKKLVANVLATNKPVFRMLARLPFPVSCDNSSGETLVEVDLTRLQVATP